MMGRQSADQRRFFYDFCLEDHVPADHLLRRIDGLFMEDFWLIAVTERTEDETETQSE